MKTEMQLGADREGTNKKSSHKGRELQIWLLQPYLPIYYHRSYKLVSFTVNEDGHRRVLAGSLAQRAFLHTNVLQGAPSLHLIRGKYTNPHILLLLQVTLSKPAAGARGLG